MLSVSILCIPPAPEYVFPITKDTPKLFLQQLIQVERRSDTLLFKEISPVILQCKIYSPSNENQVPCGMVA